MAEITPISRDSKYHISSENLRIREYGRHIQNMVTYALALEDREYRSRVAKEIVRMMVDLNPDIKEEPGYEQKLWDHIHVISDFKLDVDSPYPIPDKEEVLAKVYPKMAYHRNKPKKRQYGRNVGLMVAKAIEMEESPERAAYINQIAYTMKQFLRPNERDSLPEAVLATHIQELSGGKLKVTADDIQLPKHVNMRAQPSNLVHHTKVIRKRKKKGKSSMKQSSRSGRSNRSGGNNNSNNNNGGNRRRRRR